MLIITEQAAEAVLVEHQRISLRSCSCGWSGLGRSFAQHTVEQMAIAAGDR